MKSLVVALIISFFITCFVFAVKKRMDKGTTREEDVDFVCEKLMCLLSFEWKFLEQLCEELFALENKELHQALERILAEDKNDKQSQNIFFDTLIITFVQKDLVRGEPIVYSRATLRANPHVFNLLPEWRREECEYFLEPYNQYPDNQVLEIINHTKNEIEYLPAKDVGEVLIRVKKGMNYKPDDDDPKEGIQNPFLRPGFNLT